MDNGLDEDDSHSRCLEVSIRRARLSDVDDIAKMYSNSIEYLDAESREWVEGIVRKRSRRARIYVATLNGRIIGFALVYKRRDKAYIDALAVDQEYRGRGIGPCLLGYVEEVLLSEGVERIYLTVKNNNHRALGMYIKSGYRISNVILLLEAKSKTLESSTNTIDSVVVKVDSVKRSISPRAKLLDAVMWSNFTGDIDDSIYRVSGEEATIVSAYRGRRLLGIARFYVHQDKVVIERLALSFYRPTESLRAIINAVRIKLALEPEKTIVIPIDATKIALLRTLISIGFRVVDSEYVLYKDLAEDRVWRGAEALTIQ